MIAADAGILVAMLGVMALGWAVQRAAHNGGWTDVFWTYGTGVTSAVAALAPLAAWPAPAWRRLMVAGLVIVWSLRLGTYVALRVARGAEDVRYASLREIWGRRLQPYMFALLIVQAPITALLALSILYAAHQPAAGLRLADVLGIAIMAAAILGETAADRQMHHFKADPATHGKVCDSGLWAWSRHPNYFFEVLGWLAYPVIATTTARPATFLAWIAPVLMFVVVRYATGIPPLERAMVRAKGDAYRRYQARVSPLLPWPPKT